MAENTTDWNLENMKNGTAGDLLLGMSSRCNLNTLDCLKILKKYQKKLYFKNWAFYLKSSKQVEIEVLKIIFEDCEGQ